MAETFEYWMQMEKHYARLERNWADHGDYTWAERCNKLRWRCMDLALEVLYNAASYECELCHEKFATAQQLSDHNYAGRPSH